MNAPSKLTCRLVRPSSTYDGKQGLSYFEGIAAQIVGSTGICMHLLTIPPGGRAKAYLHEAHETAIYVLSGQAHTWYGKRLEEYAVVRAGELFYIPPPRAASSGEPVGRAVHGGDCSNRSEQAGKRVVLLPDLDGLVIL